MICCAGVLLCVGWRACVQAPEPQPVEVIGDSFVELVC